MSVCSWKKIVKISTEQEENRWKRKLKKCGRQKVKLQSRQTQRGQIRVTFLKRTQTHTLTLGDEESRRAKTLDLPVSPSPPATHAHVCERDGNSVLLGVSVSMSSHL